MNDFRNCKKFVAIIDEETSQNSDKSWFYIADVDTWNERQTCLKDALYNEKIYEEIEDLGYACLLEEGNHFSVARNLDMVDDLAELLKTLPYIKAIDGKEDYVDPNAMPSFDDYHNRIVNIVLKYKSLAKNRVIIDDVIDRFNEDKVTVSKAVSELKDLAEFGFISHAQENKVPNEQIFYDITDEMTDVKKCEAFIVKYLSRKKVIYCLPRGEDSARLFAFDSVKALENFKVSNEAYQKLQQSLYGKQIEEDEQEDEYENLFSKEDDEIGLL